MADQPPIVYGSDEHITMRELVEASPAIHDLEARGGTYDYSLPQSWWDAFHEVMGQAPLGFVWAYEKEDIWGRPMPLTWAAAQAMVEFEKRGGPVR